MCNRKMKKKQQHKLSTNYNNMIIYKYTQKTTKPIKQIATIALGYFVLHWATVFTA